MNDDRIPPHGREHDGSAIGNCTSNECSIRGRCSYPTACRRTDGHDDRPSIAIELDALLAALAKVRP